MGWAPHVIALTGIASFVLTVMSLHATKFATPLTVSVLGALKQASSAVDDDVFALCGVLCCVYVISVDRAYGLTK